MFAADDSTSWERATGDNSGTGRLRRFVPDHSRLESWSGRTGAAGRLSEAAPGLESLAGSQFPNCLIDARVEGKHGGTGRIVDWELLGREYDRSEWPPLILAGGLTPENVADAIQAVKPWGVDVASGVESAPGVKDISLVEQFIRSAREAFQLQDDAN